MNIFEQLGWLVHMDGICAFRDWMWFFNVVFQCNSQVGVLYERQRFPVWIESGSVLVLQAVSTSPSKLVSVLHSTHVFVLVFLA